MDENPRQPPDVRRSSIIARALLPLFLCLRPWQWPQSDMADAPRMPLAMSHAHGGAAGVWRAVAGPPRSLPTPGSSQKAVARCRRMAGLENGPRGDMKPFRSPAGRRFSIAAFELDARPKETPLARQGRALGGAGSFGVSEPRYISGGGHVRANGSAAIRLWGHGKVGEWLPPASGFHGPGLDCSPGTPRRGRPVPLVRGAHGNGQFALQ